MKAKIYFIELDKLQNFDEYKYLMKFVSLEKQLKINEFKFDIDKKLSLLSEIIIRYIACKSLNIKNEDLYFGETTYGKPYLLGYDNFNYNISHTRDAIIIGVSEFKIGVDIEKVRPMNLDIAKKFFHKNELDYILSENNAQNECFYEVWTKKEAYTKILGKGLTIVMNYFDVTNVEKKYIFSTFKINNYIFSICSSEQLDYSNIIFLTADNIKCIRNNF